jgi:hypothetical protein
VSDQAQVIAAFLAFKRDAREVVTVLRTRTAVVETKGGGSYSYDYADLGDVLDAVEVPLLNHGLAISQDVTTMDGRAAVTTWLLHESGECLGFGPLALSAGQTPQAYGSAVTYARRYAILAALGLAPEDDDGQAAADEARMGQAARSAPQRAPEGPPRGSTEPVGATQLAPGVGNLIRALNNLPQEQRTATMTEFTRQFGPPAKLAPERVQEAAAWVADRMAPVEQDDPWDRGYSG